MIWKKITEASVHSVNEDYQRLGSNVSIYRLSQGNKQVNNGSAYCF